MQSSDIQCWRLQAQCDLQERSDYFKLSKKTKIDHYDLLDIFLEEPCITGSKVTANRCENRFKVNDCGITLDNFTSLAKKDGINKKRFVTRADIPGGEKNIYKVIENLVKRTTVLV